jgi:prevent-host-death family protein
MKAFTVREAKTNLEEIFRAVVESNEQAILVTDQGEQAILISVSKFQAMHETKILIN